MRLDATGRYGLTLRLVSLAFRHLAASGIVDAAQPILDALAREAGELVRLSSQAASGRSASPRRRAPFPA